MKGRSRKTRIETLLGRAEGLDGIWVWKVDPEKQGLKPLSGLASAGDVNCLKGRSRKTRIETDENDSELVECSLFER